MKCEIELVNNKNQTILLVNEMDLQLRKLLSAEVLAEDASEESLERLAKALKLDLSGHSARTAVESWFA